MFLCVWEVRAVLVGLGGVEVILEGYTGLKLFLTFCGLEVVLVD